MWALRSRPTAPVWWSIPAVPDSYLLARATGFDRMVDPSLEELVCLHLHAHRDAHGRTPASEALTAVGIGDAVAVDEDAVSRIRLIERLGALVDDGLVAAEERPVESRPEPRTVYTLTEAGHEYAATVRERLASETVALADGTAGADEPAEHAGRPGEVALSEVGRYVEDAELSLVTALARLRRDRPLSPAGDDGSRFVGREAPLSAVAEAIEASVERGSRTVLVAGDAGLGKTALVQEAVDRVAESRADVVLARGAARAGATGPYEPLRRAFEAVPGGESVVDELPSAGATVTPDDPAGVEAQRTSVFNDVADALREASTDRPVVVFVDNLQWADRATLELFGHLATTITEWLYPVAFVGAYRQAPVATGEGHPLDRVLERLQREGALEQVELGPLSTQATAALVARTLGRQEVPEPFVEAVHERTGGVPLLVSSTVSHLLEEGVVDPATGTYPESGAALDVPGAVVEQVGRRLEALDAAGRDLLATAAVVGERVDATVLAAATDLPAARRREYVDQFVAGRVFERVASPAVGWDGALRFVSGLFREAVLESLDPATAERLHGRVADALIDVYGAEAGERAAAVADHLERAGDVERALPFYRRAGEHAFGSYANEAAVEHYRRALDVGGSLEAVDARTLAAVAGDLAEVHATVGAFDRAVDVAEEGLSFAPAGSRVAGELLGVRADVELRGGDHEAAERTAERMRDLADGLDADDLVAEALRKLGNLARKRGEYDRARTREERSLELSRRADDRGGEARSLVNLGVVDVKRGALDAARERYRESLAIKRDLGDRQGEGRVLGNLGIVELQRGDLGAARETQEESLAAFREVGDRHGAARTLGNLGVVARRQGDFDAAREYYREARELFQVAGDEHGEARVLGNLGSLAYRQGDHETAQRRHRESLRLKREVGDRSGAARSLSNLGVALSETGAYREARERYRESRRLYADIDEPAGEARSRNKLGRVAARLGEFERAREHLEASLATLREQSDPTGEGRALKNLGRLAQETGSPDAAAERYREAIDRLEAAGERHDTAHVRHHLGTVARQRGDLEAARERLEASLARFEGMDDPQFAALSRGYLGLVAMQEGDEERGRERVSAATERLRSMGVTPHVNRLVRRRIETERAVGADDRARALCVDARERLQSAGRPRGHQAEQLAALCETVVADG